jgi:hypothetical protein
MLPSLHRCSISTGPAARCELRPPIDELPADAAEVILKLLAVLEDETHPCQLLSTLSRVRRDGLFGDTAVRITYEALNSMQLSEALKYYDQHYASTMPTMPEAKRRAKAVQAVCSDVLRLHRLFKEANKFFANDDRPNRWRWSQSGFKYGPDYELPEPYLWEPRQDDGWDAATEFDYFFQSIIEFRTEKKPVGYVEYPTTIGEIFERTLTLRNLYEDYVLLAMPAEAVKHEDFRKKLASYSSENDNHPGEHAHLVQQIVGKYGPALEYVSPELKANEEVAMAAVQNEGFALAFTGTLVGPPREERFVKAAFKTISSRDRIVKAAVKNNGHALRLVKNWAGLDDDIFEAAIEQNPEALQHVPDERQTVEMVIKAVKKQGSTLYYARDDILLDPTVQKAAVENDGGAIDAFADLDPQGAKRLALLGLRTDGRALQYASHDSFTPDSFNLILKAVEDSPDALQFVILNVPREFAVKLCLAAVKEWTTLEWVGRAFDDEVITVDDYRKIMSEAIEQLSKRPWTLIRPRNDILGSENDYMSSLEDIRWNGWCTPDLARKAIAVIPEFFFGMPKEFKTRALAIAVVTQEGHLLAKMESPQNGEFTKDKRVVLAAVRNRGSAYQHASPELKRDKDVITAALKKDGRIISLETMFSVNRFASIPEGLITYEMAMLAATTIFTSSALVAMLSFPPISDWIEDVQETPFSPTSDWIENKKKIYQLYLAAVRSNGEAILAMPKGMFGKPELLELCSAAVESNGKALDAVLSFTNGFSPLEIFNLCLTAVKQNGLALQAVGTLRFSRDEFSTLIVQALRQTWDAAQFVPEEFYLDENVRAAASGAKTCVA